MVVWLGGTDQYKLWHPTDHLFSDWESKAGISHIGSSHLVHEYLAGSDGPIYNPRINFRDPAEFFDPVAYAKTVGVAICARIGLLEAPLNLGLMTHFVRNTSQGCEMRRRFFLGYIESRDPGRPILADAARDLRHENVTADLARRLHQHATEEMSYLSGILPVLYRQVTQDHMF